MDDKCRCDGTALRGSDHCPTCFCEQFEERCKWPEEKPWNEREDGAKWAQALRRGK